MARYAEDPDDPDHLIDRDELDALARARAERAVDALPLDEARREALAREESAAPDATAPTSRPRSAAPVLVIWALGLPLALLVRLVTLPFRSALRRALHRRADRARAAALEAAMSASRRAAQSGRAEDWLASGLAWMEVGQAARAEAAFDAALGAADASEAIRAAATRNRGVARVRMGLPKLGARDLAAAPAAPPPSATTTLREAFLLARIGLTALAGLDPDD